jgi:hypothetical protein
MAVTVARKFEPFMRIDGLSWWHHLAVTRLEQSERMTWLTRAAEEEWSVDTLRHQLREDGANHPKPRDGKTRPKRLVAQLIKLNREEIPDELRVELRRWWQQVMLDAEPG